MQVIRKYSELKQALAARKWSLALVPTMGALHKGHLSLMDIAKGRAEKVIVSIFVNPKQFGPNEDFAAYPRQEESDLAKLEEEKVEFAYLPRAEEFYPPGFSTNISVKNLGEVLCGVTRPGHFDGVATVVAKLFTEIMPDIAVFGEKDFQQLMIIRRMAKDLMFPIDVIGAPIMREKDGLAMSSRNAYLSLNQRSIASSMFNALRAAAEEIGLGASPQDAAAKAKDALLKAGYDKVDYVEAREVKTLQPYENHAGVKGRIFGAAYLGKTRLIDNVEI